MVQLSRIGSIQVSGDALAAAQLREDWLHTVQQLQQQVTHWAQEQQWEVRFFPEKKITEDPLGTYSVPVLQMITENGTVVLEPHARNVRGSDGRVDLYAYPALNRVRLLYKESDQTWTIRTDSGLDWPFSWGEQTFVNIVKGLACA